MVDFLIPGGSLWLLLFLIHTVALVIATYYDIKYRIIPDKVWLFLLLASGLVLIYQLATVSHSTVFFILYAMNAFFGIFIGLTMFYTGAWGGADSKAIMTIGITYPYVPFFSTCSLPPVLIVSVNFLFITILVVLGFLIYNLLSRLITQEPLFQNVKGTTSQKIMALVSGFKETPNELLASKFLEPLERKEDDAWVLVAQLFQKIPDDEELENIKKQIVQQAIESNKEKLWVRPQPPGILFLLFAFLVSASFGNPVLEFLLC